MHHKSSKTALLFFTRQAAAEAAAKDFTYKAASKSNVQIAAHLISQTLITLRQTPFPVFTYSGDEFAVTGFGPKLSEAVAAVFARGFEEVIIIGNDCPALSASLLIKTQVALKENAVVLGPTKNNGVYLIGLTKAAFNKLDFARLPWQTNQALKSLQQIAAAANYSVDLLPLLNDINSAADLKQIISQFIPQISSLKYLQCILASLNQRICTVIKPYTNFFYGLNLPNRAPPANTHCW